MGAAGAAFWVQTLGNKAFIEVKPKIRGKIRRCALGNKETFQKKKIKRLPRWHFFSKNTTRQSTAAHGTHAAPTAAFFKLQYIVRKIM